MSSSIEAYLLTVAKAVALRSTCRRKVGCVLADERGRILATGYNGPASGVAHCDERGCSMTGCSSGGCTCSTVSGGCDAVHAEANALLQCANINNVYYAAVTRAPCLPCTRFLLNSSCSVIIYEEESSYADTPKDYFLRARSRKGIEVRWERIDG